MARNMRLSKRTIFSKNIDKPQYDRYSMKSGIVHLGLGAFHRSHQAVYTDDALASNGGNWKIIAINIRRTDIVDHLNQQDGLFTVFSRGVKDESIRVIGSISHAIAASRDIEQAIAAIASSEIKIISLTLTEKGYYLDHSRHGLNVNNMPILGDIKNINHPKTGVGLLIAGLIRRYHSHQQPVTLMCCDNLPSNGALLRQCVVEFSEQVDANFRKWIEKNISFPSTMVDRITPKTTEKTLTNILRKTGYTDLAAIECEEFSQWVIEDNFISGRPTWEEGGAIFVDKIAPYELAKLRMLNGTHSLIAYSGYVAGLTYVRDTFQYPHFTRLIKRHLRAALKTLPILTKNFDLTQYESDLLKRFANPSIAHETYQIAMDGSEKLSQRLLSAACDALDSKQSLRPFSFAVTAWMRYCLGYTDSGDRYLLRDPQEISIQQSLNNCQENTKKTSPRNAEKIMHALHNLDHLFPRQLVTNIHWSAQVLEILTSILEKGMLNAIEEEMQ